MAERRRKPRRWRRALKWLGLTTLVWGSAIACGMNPSVPSDFVINAWPIPAVDPALQAEPGRRLVVLQHGLWRSAWALWRLERALRAHGYEVLNVSYPSTRARIEDHAAALGVALRAHLDADPEPAPKVYFVGHSMGGLVIRAYLSRADAVRPAACVFIGTPHYGAALAKLRLESPLFHLLMGDLAARQLVPGDPLFGTLHRIHDAPVGTIVGGYADERGQSEELAGDDDGTVSVREAHLAEEVDSILLPLGHTRLTLHRDMIAAALHFLHDGHF